MFLPSLCGSFFLSKVVARLFTVVSSCLSSFPLKLKEDHDSIRESHTKLEIQVKTSEMELENHAKRAAQLEGEIKGKVCNVYSGGSREVPGGPGGRGPLLWEQSREKSP